MGKGCFQCLKVFVVIINTLFLLIGLAILGLSLFLYFDTKMKSVRENSGSRMALDIALFVAMGVGGLTVLVSTFGCCGAFKESSCLLGAYFVCLLLICGVEIGGGVYLYVRQMDTEAKNYLIETFRSSIRSWNATSVPEPMRALQKSLQCCGANGTKDYDDPRTAEAVCKSDDGKLYAEGCIDKLLANSLWVLIAILSVAALELLSMIMAIYLCCAAKSDDEGGYVGVSTD